MIIPPLLKHQRDAARFIRKRGGRGLLGFEPGTGKTRIGLEMGRQGRLLVFAPLNPTLFTWPEQNEVWTPELRLEAIRGTPKERERMLYDKSIDIAVVNYELLGWLYDVAARRKGLPFEQLYLDECTAFKSHQSVSFKVIKAIESVFDVVVPVTGTPSPNSLHDMWSQLYPVDRGKALGKNISHFRERYFTQIRHENYFEWKCTDPDGLMADAAPLCLVRTADECVDMPPLNFQKVEYELPPKARRLYDDVRRHKVLSWHATEMAMKSAGVGTNKLQQIASGFFYDKLLVPHVVHEAKLSAFASLVEEMNDTPLLTLYLFDHEREMIRRKLGYEVPSIDSTTTIAEKRRYFADWRKGRIPVLLGQSKAIELGMNMQSPFAHVAFYSLPWSHQTYWQCIGRVWRQGQKSKVIVHNFQGRNTIDHRVAKVLTVKKATEDQLKTVIREYEREAA